jgi:hypothetical protein
MTLAFDNIVQHLFHQPSLQSVTVGELERMAVQHPSFAAVQYLLLKKMQETAHPGFNTQLHKTALYFNNPLWLQFLLQPQKETIAGNAREEEQLVSHKEEQYSAVHTTEAMPPVEETALTSVPSLEEHGSEPATMIAIAEEYNYNNTDKAEAVAEHINEATGGELVEGPVQETVTAIAEEYMHMPVAATEKTGETIEPEYESMNVIAEEYNRIGTIDESTTAEQIVTETTAAEEAHHEQVADPAFVHDNNPGVIEEEIPAEQINTVEIEPVQETNNAMAATEEYSGPAEIETTIPVEQKTVEPANGSVSETTETAENNKTGSPLLKTIIETAGAKDDLLFEPYHTIDYFASQGIKLSKIEPEPTDKLGKQLKSFTEWLKSMRKLPQTSVDKILAENDESEVVAAANHSVEAKEVITETMAEVFEKQGLHEKATEVYRKLSLLNPGKSAYFASRIEALKQL